MDSSVDRGGVGCHFALHSQTSGEPVTNTHENARKRTEARGLLYDIYIYTVYNIYTVYIPPGIPTTTKEMGVNITTIGYLRVLIIQIGSTIILMVVEAQGTYIWWIFFYGFHVDKYTLPYLNGAYGIRLLP